ncbi:hypothetical protein [Nostoc sp. MG11]|uniref:hypothetical protein n=1 Tax=Nostoc sp. MG11 TaxID=2721166 RepID=UPI001868F127|nr:hypothetical protein [Nostoc sp. MG11]
MSQAKHSKSHILSETQVNNAKLLPEEHLRVLALQRNETCANLVYLLLIFFDGKQLTMSRAIALMLKIENISKINI